MMKKKKKRGRPKKPLHTRVGAIYWEGQTFGRGRRYQLLKVTTSRGGVKPLSKMLTRKEARIFADAWNKAKGKRGKRVPVL